MPISYDFKTIFVHIPKNAGTSVEKYLGTGHVKQLYSHLPCKDSLINYPKTMDNLFEFENVCPQHLSAWQLKQIIEPSVFKSFYKFAVIGDPYNRMISEYLYVQDNEHARYKPYQRMTFKGFIIKAFKASVIDQLAIFDGHLLTQKSFIVDNTGNRIVEHIFSMDDIPTLETELAELTGVKHSLTRARESKKVDRAALLTSEIKDLIYEKFIEDFEFFGFQR